MQLTDLADVQLVSARSVGMKTDEEVVKLTFRSGKKEEELVFFQGLFCHALDLPDDGLPGALKDKQKLLDNARTNVRLNAMLSRLW